jgi:NADPH:quinone reductase-like Zn-dependent oxidoreductase
MAPTIMKAVITDGKNSVELREVPVPKPGPKEALVKVVAVAQNPTDCMLKLRY